MRRPFISLAGPFLPTIGFVLLSRASPCFAAPGHVDARTTDTAKVFAYKKTPQRDLSVYLDFPTGWKAQDKRPAIVFFSGGAWSVSTLNQFRTKAAYLASRGMVAARADYRVRKKDGATPDVCVQDARSAMRWLRANAATLGIDPQRIAAGGSSAGGHLAACCSLDGAPNDPADDLKISCRPDALVLISCVTDLATTDRAAQFAEVVGAEVAKSISPLLYISAGTPPTLVMCGSEDRWLPQGKAYVEKANAAGARADLYIAEGQPHPFASQPPWDQATVKLIDEFLASLGWLTGPPTVQVPDGAALEGWHP
ncbi:MAG: alpha/beta hydrolase [Candidatus Sumerlaeota bacterium]|nr:alpha/beta hydrolase [Candidatus Sumerlaeota bacterium]